MLEKDNSVTLDASVSGTVLAAGGVRKIAPISNSERQRRWRERLRSKALLVRSVEVPENLVRYMLEKGLTSVSEMQNHPEKFNDALNDLLELIAQGRLKV